MGRAMTEPVTADQRVKRGKTYRKVRLALKGSVHFIDCEFGGTTFDCRKTAGAIKMTRCYFEQCFVIDRDGNKMRLESLNQLKNIIEGKWRQAP